MFKFLLNTLWMVVFGTSFVFAQAMQPTGLQVDPDSSMPQWEVYWYVLTEPGVFAPHVIGRSFFPLEFVKDWGLGPVYSVYEDRIGFKASTTIYVPFDFDVGFRFIANARNGLAFYIDGRKIFDHYAVLDDVNVDQWYTLSPGWHRLELHYQHWTGEAYVSFEIGVETDALLWYGLTLQRKLDALSEQISVLQQKITALEEEISRLKAKGEEE